MICVWYSLQQLEQPLLYAMRLFQEAIRLPPEKMNFPNISFFPRL